MAATNYDAGSILGNLFNDIKSIPTRSMQDSRALRLQQQRDQIQAQALQDRRDSALKDNPALSAAYTPAASDQSLGQRLAGAAAGQSIGQSLVGAAPGQSIGQKLLGIDPSAPGQTLMQKLTGAAPDQSIGSALIGGKPGQSMGEALAGARPGQSIAQSLVGAADGVSAGRSLLGLGAGRHMAPVDLSDSTPAPQERIQQAPLSYADTPPTTPQPQGSPAAQSSPGRGATGSALKLALADYADPRTDAMGLPARVAQPAVNAGTAFASGPTPTQPGQPARPPAQPYYSDELARFLSMAAFPKQF